MPLEYALRSLEDAEVFNLLSEMVYIAYVDTCEVIFLNDVLRQRIGEPDGREALLLRAHAWAHQTLRALQVQGAFCRHAHGGACL